ncbi:MAG: YjjG family noncanonical pyrimidine nucleotidase [Bacteroidales bacterium]|nr:YjjG family noncanonical pyrimidine nucleotidase [Bacteroidales bacterium]MBP5516980.1 YjjG family noncanonical pyrimidine nucleotidase [Bacteroidales bacterium]
MPTCQLPVKYLLFDLDRTLWDFDGNADCTFRSMFVEFELEKLCHVDYNVFHERYKAINDTLWEAYRNGILTKELLSLKRFSLTLASFGCDADSPAIVALSNKLSDYYVLKGPLQTGLMPGARELLEWLDKQRDRYCMAVITNGFSEAQLPKMKTAGIDRYFDYFLLSEDLGYMKPDRRFFEEALKKMHAQPSECFVVGDDYKVDIVGAMNAGIKQVWYNLSGSPLPQGLAVPTYEIRELQELITILDK